MNMFQGVETTNQKIGRSAMIETYLQLGVNGEFSIDQISGILDTISPSVATKWRTPHSEKCPLLRVVR